jgi:hypothetical protein
MLTSCAATNKYDVAIADRCTGIDSNEPSKSALTDASGGENWFLKEVLEKANNQDDIATKLTDYMQNDGSTDVGQKGVGLVLFFLVLLTWWCCCYTCCPCCKCCRVCRAKDEKKPTGFPCKLVGTIVTLGIGAGLVVCWIFSAAAYEDIDNGIERLGCSAARFAKALSEGQTSPAYFIGVTPMVTRFGDLSNIFDDGSTFVTSFNSLIDGTDTIDKAFAFATETLSLLEEMMDVAENANPTGHECMMCGPLKTKLTEVKSIMADSLASALKTAREDAKSALDTDKRAELRTLLTDSTKPLTEIDDLLGDALDDLVDADTWDQVRSGKDQGKMTMFALPGLGMVATLFGILGCLAFLLRENSSDGQTTALPHRCGCCSWCCGFLVAALCFVIGGFLQVLGVPLGVVCLTLDEFSGSVIDNTQPALELDLTGDSLSMMKDIVDKCLNPPDFTVSANFADILQITNASGQTVTMRQMIEADLKDAIDTPFNELTSKMSGVTTALAEDSGVIALRQFVYEHGGNISSLILTNQALMETAMSTAGVVIPSATFWSADAYPNNVYTTLNCNDYTFEGQTLKGNEDYWAAFTNSDDQAGTASARLCGWPTNDLSACTDTDKCPARSFIVKTKASLMDASATSFRCDEFQSSSGVTCDPWVADANGIASGWLTCMDSTTNAYTRETIQCTLADFENYLTKFDTRIDVAFKTLDSTANSMETQINVGLRDLLTDTILDEITDILNGLECNFLGEYYKTIIWGACYEGVGGIAYIGFIWVIMGALMIALIIATYALWRRSIDNYNLGDTGEGPGNMSYADDDTN